MQTDVLEWDKYLKSIKLLLSAAVEESIEDPELALLLTDQPRWLQKYKSEGTLEAVLDAELDVFEVDTSHEGGSIQTIQRYKNGLYVVGLSPKHRVFDRTVSLLGTEIAVSIQNHIPCPGLKAKQTINTQDVVCTVTLRDKTTGEISQVPIFSTLRGFICEVNKSVSFDSSRVDRSWVLIVAPPKKQRFLSNLANICQPFTASKGACST
eukprot:Protomagalhaensia_wolfi_Nauph_80__3105@NODE_3176_length_865_cov_4_199758_g2488_i0_p1_GENE_NODE_3176_length_865_cov_4_199758_g2488_i0NODE_3176_length_865_cov_4_199758_g2488_i0_p1_ORF_typecomplete_len209_score24_98_NODE_3176_length_865_cov_4_199758_g2488_i060686